MNNVTRYYCTDEKDFAYVLKKYNIANTYNMALFLYPTEIKIFKIDSVYKFTFSDVRTHIPNAISVIAMERSRKLNELLK